MGENISGKFAIHLHEKLMGHPSLSAYLGNVRGLGIQRGEASITHYGGLHAKYLPDTRAPKERERQQYSVIGLRPDTRKETRLRAISEIVEFARTLLPFQGVEVLHDGDALSPNYNKKGLHVFAGDGGLHIRHVA